MHRFALPAAALTPADVPQPDAEFSDILRFADLADGYAYADHDELVVLQNRLDAAGPYALSIRELWTLLFGMYRAHRHGGGYRDSPLIGKMRALTAEIGRRVEARGPGLDVWEGDITRLIVGAVVNAANERMLGGSGVDGAIHKAAGPKLLEACRAVPEVRPGVRCPTGEARITPGFQLPADHVIHTVGPVWHGGRRGEAGLLASAYRSSLALADAHGLEAVAFPALSTGVYGFPADRAARIAVDTVRDWQAAHERPVRVLLVGYDAAAASTLRAAIEA